jgi:hypothetical protein
MRACDWKDIFEERVTENVEEGMGMREEDEDACSWTGAETTISEELTAFCPGLVEIESPLVVSELSARRRAAARRLAKLDIAKPVLLEPGEKRK